MNVRENDENKGTEATHVFEKNRDLCDEIVSEEANDSTSICWNDAEIITPSISDEPETISHDKSLEYFRGADLSEYNDKIPRTLKISGNIFSSCFSKITKCKLKKEQITDYNLFFLIAKCPYQSDDRTHVAMLRTVYDSLVPPNKDSHFSWENIGFQSNLPWTDLRGVGMLGVLQLLYMCTLCPILGNILYGLSINKSNGFPFAVVGLNMTSIVLNLLRNEKLNREVNVEGVFVYGNKLYAAIFNHFREIWIRENKTILDIGGLLKGIERSCSSNRTRIKFFKNLERDYGMRFSIKKVC